MNPIKDRTGQRYGRLTVIGIAGRNSRGKILWRCKCDCGNEILRESGTLKPGRECSCGCARAEIGVKNNLKAQKKRVIIGCLSVGIAYGQRHRHPCSA